MWIRQKAIVHAQICGQPVIGRRASKSPHMVRNLASSLPELRCTKAPMHQRRLRAPLHNVAVWGHCPTKRDIDVQPAFSENSIADLSKLVRAASTGDLVGSNYPPTYLPRQQPGPNVTYAMYRTYLLLGAIESLASQSRPTLDGLVTASPIHIPTLPMAFTYTAWICKNLSVLQRHL